MNRGWGIWGRWICLTALLLSSAGCFETEVEFSKSITRTIEGDALMFKVKARRHGSLFEPIKANKPGKTEDLYYIEMVSLVVEVTDESAGPGDEDDLLFLEEVDVYVEPLKEGTHLERVEAGWFNRETFPPEEPTRLEFVLNPFVPWDPYFREGFQLVFESTYRVPPDDVTLKGTARFEAVTEVF